MHPCVPIRATSSRWLPGEANKASSPSSFCWVGAPRRASRPTVYLNKCACHGPGPSRFFLAVERVFWGTGHPPMILPLTLSLFPVLLFTYDVVLKLFLCVCIVCVFVYVLWCLIVIWLTHCLFDVIYVCSVFFTGTGLLLFIHY